MKKIIFCALIVSLLLVSITLASESSTFSNITSICISKCMGFGVTKTRCQSMCQDASCVNLCRDAKLGESRCNVVCPTGDIFENENLSIQDKTDILETAKSETKTVIIKKASERFNDMYKAREVAKQMLNDAKEIVKAAKTSYGTEVSKYKEYKNKFISSKDSVKSCTTDCSKKENELKDISKKYLLHITYSIESSVEKVKGKVMGSEKLSESEAGILLKKIENINNNISAIKLEINAISIDSNKEDITKLATNLNTIWIESKAIILESKDKLVNANIAGIIVQSQKLNARLDKVMLRLENDTGFDKAKVRELKIDFEAAVNESNVHFEKSEMLFNEADTALNPIKNEKLDEAHKETTLAHARLKDARAILSNIEQEIKKSSKGSEELVLNNVSDKEINV